ncbi:hypothetical protein ACOMHN_003025 [Nucella lapillus]
MPPSHLNSLLTQEPSSKQASVCRLERELKAAKEENKRLRVQLEETRSALKEMTTEASLDNFDERRVNLLKMQIVQLQRQVLLMSEALGSRSTVLMEVENALTWLSEKFRHYIRLDVKGAEVPVFRSDLITMVDTSESARLKLFKNVETCSRENLSQPQLLMNHFLKPGVPDAQYTTLDCCLGLHHHLNLKHVTQLESKLSMLYKELITVSQYLNGRAGTSGAGGSEPGDRASAGHVSRAVREREGTVILRACAMARDCAADLLSLSLLFPSAPWPPLKRPLMSEVTYEALAPALPALAGVKAAEVRRCVRAALKACSHRGHMAGQEAAALREEVQFHQALHHLQLQYVQQVSDALRNGYSEFEQSTNDLLIQPLKRLLAAYRQLKNNSSQEGLREFLTILKQQEPQWMDIIQKLDISDPQNQSGSGALSAYGEEFFASLTQRVLERQRERDKVVAQRDDLKVTQQRLEQELRALITARQPDSSTTEGQLDCADLKRQQSNTGEQPAGTDLKHHAGAGAAGGAGAGGDVMVDSDTSRLSHGSLSGIADEGTEALTGLRPWLEDSAVGAPDRGGKKKGRKREGGAVAQRRPWQDAGDMADHRGAAPIPSPSSGRSSARSRSEGRGGERGGITGLRPWLDVHGAADQPNGLSDQPNGLSEGDRQTPVREHSDTPLEGGSRGSLYGCHSSRRLGEEDAAHRDRPQPQPGHALDRQPPSVALAPNQSSQHSEGNVSVKPVQGQPPASTAPSPTHPPPGSQKSKRPAKPKNYEPKLYVANRTLSLRRSGSLSRLSEPSLQERLAKTALSRPQALKHSTSEPKSRTFHK